MMLNYFDISVSQKDVVVLGTGGASNAIVQYLIDQSCRSICLVSRNNNTSNAKGVEVIPYKDLKHRKKDIIINTTPVGMYPNTETCPVTAEQIIGIETAIDLIYNPIHTQFVDLGLSVGAKSISGLYMLVGQAIKAQEIWQGFNLSDQLTEKIFKEMLSHF